jgi:hypothetical protein
VQIGGGRIAMHQAEYGKYLTSRQMETEITG